MAKYENDPQGMDLMISHSRMLEAEQRLKQSKQPVKIYHHPADREWPVVSATGALSGPVKAWITVLIVTVVLLLVSNIVLAAVYMAS